MKRIMLLAICIFAVVFPFSASESAEMGAFSCTYTLPPLPDPYTIGGVTVDGPFRVEDIAIDEESTGEILGQCVFGDSDTATTGVISPGYQFWAERSQDADGTTHITVSSNQANLPLIQAHFVKVRPPSPPLSIVWDYYHADGGVLNGPGGPYADPYQKKEFEFAGFKKLTFVATPKKDYNWMRKHALQPLQKAGYDAVQKSFEKTSSGSTLVVDVYDTLDGRALMEENVILKESWTVRSGKPYTWGNVGTYKYSGKYRGTIKATMTLPGFPNTKVWEITGDVTFEKDPDYSTDEIDVYTTSAGTITQTMYTVPDPTGLCQGIPASFTDTYPVYKGDGYLSIKSGTDPIQYQASASISAQTPVQPHPYKECCAYADPPCEDQTMEVGEQEHEWLFTGDDFRSAEANGTLKGTYIVTTGDPLNLPSGTYEWDLKPVNEGSATSPGVQLLLLGN